MHRSGLLNSNASGQDILSGCLLICSRGKYGLLSAGVPSKYLMTEALRRDHLFKDLDNRIDFAGEFND